MIKRDDDYIKLGKVYAKGNIYMHSAVVYGKTVTSALWLCSRGISFTWLNLDELDNSPTMFCRSMCSAICGKIWCDRGSLFDSLSELLYVVPMKSMTQDIFIVLDGFHMLTNKAVQRIIRLFLNRMSICWKMMLICQLPSSVFFGALA